MQKTREEYQIHIIGAGVSGLIAAQILEKHGYRPVILEASSSIGGRIKTDTIKGYQLDRGFQVLLSAYPKAIEYLDYEALELQPFLPGSLIFKNGEEQTIGDPLRNIRLLLPTMISSVGNFRDKLKIFQLNATLKKKSVDAIFQEKETSTFEYLKMYGFSDRMIAHFFKPFFSGIFLETALRTSSRMFEFVFKMFGEGLAVIPKKGMGAIPKQFEQKLSATEIHYNTVVSQVKEGEIFIKDGTILKSDLTLIATDPSTVLHGLKHQEVHWQQCSNLYFETYEKKFPKPIIALIADKNTLINNLHYPTSLETNTRGKNQLLSVTVVEKHGLDEAQLVVRVKEELATYCNIQNPTFIKCYHIRQALPILSTVQNDLATTETKISDTIFLAGDHLLNGSLNAAIQSGEKAALALVETLGHI